MSNSFVGEIRCFAASYVPAGWLACDGSTYQISQYPALHAIIANNFGGSLQRGTFCVPNLQGRAVAGVGEQPSPGLAFAREYGEGYGGKKATLSYSNIPPHTHTLQRITAKYAQKTAVPSATSELGNLEKSDTDIANLFSPDVNGANTSLDGTTIGFSGSAAPAAISTLPPYSAMYFGICWEGVWPPQP